MELPVLNGGSMYDLTITEDDRQLLLDILNCCINDLKDEIVHTDRLDYRQGLKNRREAITMLEERLLHLTQHAKAVHHLDGP
jgi:hypothetical protein